ncbi:MarR family winged helix-turn-helix transcriptional regulator [Variovorax sp.]|jgi:DNA-binding MarR family transcriptional regulator|uniref:MarR family winged helix-turn-helix transcriptional regulator n=1 Tax=Variovorax sp. TaxID=1871043 RepID=UPI00120C7FE6|nr:MarR family winged helix-turn-helix transcriptional regulator [Variovorax sp.]TAJ58789.1 MAG: MarR family transcriptional regulator [Variovorax sp.]
MPAKKTPSAPRRAQRASPPAKTQERRHDGHDPVVGRPVPGLATDFIGWLVTSLSVRLSRSASSYYMQRWDIGTTEYRLLLALGVEHECSAAFVAAAADVDKAAASRSLQVLSQQGLVVLARHGREMTISLTETGRSLSQELYSTSLQRETRLTHGMSAAQVKRLRADLHQLIENLPRMGDDSLDADPAD